MSTAAGPSRVLQVPLPRAVLPVVALAAATAAVVAFDPVHHDVPLCPFHAATGLWCPFCGSLRAVWLLAHLHVGAALASNVLLFAAAPWFALRWWRGVTGRDAVRLRWRGRPVAGRTVAIAVIVLLIAFTVVRNTPAGAFLAPAA